MTTIANLTGNKKSGSSGSSSTGSTEDPNTLITNTVAKAVYLFSEGPVDGLSTGDGQSLYFNDVPLIDSNGNNNYQGVSWTFREGLPDQDVIPGFGSPTNVVPVGTKVTTGSPQAVEIAGNYDAVNVTVSIPTLVHSDATTGKLTGTDLSYSIQVKTATGSYVTVFTENFFQQKTTSEYQKTYRVELPPGGSPWTVRLVRNTADSTSSSTQNDLFFGSYGLVVSGKFSYRNSCILGLQLIAKDFGNQVPSVKCKIKGIKVWVPTNYDPIARTYATEGDGTSSGIWDGTFKSAWTNNPIWIYHDLLINNRYGLGQDFNPQDNPESAYVDKWSLYTIAQFCDGMVYDGFGGQEPRYTVNIQITDKQEAYDLLQSIISTVNGMIYFSAEQVVAVADMPAQVTDIYSQADVQNGIFEYSGTALKTRHSAIISYFNDPNNLYKRSSVVYEDADLINEIGYRVLEINNFGCASRAQAMRSAKWLLHTEKNQTQTITFKAGQRAGFLTPGEVIKIFDDYKAGQRKGGRILSVSS
jgi:predicted phage tail protein